MGVLLVIAGLPQLGSVCPSVEIGHEVSLREAPPLSGLLISKIGWVLSMGDNNLLRCAFCLATLVAGLTVADCDLSGLQFCFECDNYITEVV